MSERQPNYSYPETNRADLIAEFQGPYRFLSNMWKLKHGIPTEYGEVPTTEHAYQMAKFTSPTVKAAIAAAKEGKKAKRIAKRFKREGAEINPVWRQEKVAIMEELNREKFIRNPELKELLLETDGMELQEGNNWGDTYWGISPPNSGQGENRLGHLLMRLRDEFAQQAEISPDQS